MIRFLPMIFALLLSSCADDSDSEIRRKADQFLRITTVAEVLDTIFIPNGLDQLKVDRMTTEVKTALSALKTKPAVESIKVRGRWAHIKLTNTEGGFDNLMAVNADGEWRIFWDPAGTLIWGKQEWHSRLSESDWADYHRLK